VFGFNIARLHFDQITKCKRETYFILHSRNVAQFFCGSMVFLHRFWYPV